MGERTRRLRRLIGNKTWFRKKKRRVANGSRGGKNKIKDDVIDREIEAVMFIPYTIMFIPYTIESRLQKLLQEKDDSFIQDRTGACQGLKVDTGCILYIVLYSTLVCNAGQYGTV